MKTTDFLDVTLDLEYNVYKPFRKANATSFYIDSRSNHPGYIKKELPKMVEKRVSSLSANGQIFNEAMQDYKQILTKSNYKNGEYNFNSNINKPKRKRRRNVIHFKPPFCLSVQHHIGRKFINHVKSYFRKDWIVQNQFRTNKN